VQVSTDVEALYPGHLEVVQQRYRNAIHRAGKRGLMIPAGTPRVAFLDDHTYPFMVNPHFKAWLPLLDVPESFLVIRENDKPLLLYHQPDDYWHKPAGDPTGYWVDHFDIQTIKSIKDVHNLIGDPRELMFIGEETDLAGELGIDAVNPEDALHALHFQRAYKTPYEIACIQLANVNAARGHIAAEQAFRSGLSEFEIQHRYLAAISARERQTPYSGIVALNENCAVLHYQHYGLDAPAQMYSMLIDAGAAYNGYAADVTRTYAFRDGAFGELIARMETEQLGIIDDIRPGMNYAELHRKMHLRLAGVLKDFGIVDMPPTEMVENNVTFTFLPHGLGHFLGLQTHDVGGHQRDEGGAISAPPSQYPALRLTRPIEDGQVFTIEPGLYFIPMLLEELRHSPHSAAVNWQRIEELLPCGGIRIEDNVAMIDGKPCNLTREAFSAATP